MLEVGILYLAENAPNYMPIMTVYCKSARKNAVIFETGLNSDVFVFRDKNSNGSYPTEFAGSTQKHKKIETPNQPNRNENFQKKKIFSTSKVNRSQKFAT
jgi:hypothetical protein